jgi:hypothetical protein
MAALWKLYNEDLEMLEEAAEREMDRARETGDDTDYAEGLMQMLRMLKGRLEEYK